MASQRSLDPTMLAQMVGESQKQEKSSGFSPSTDPNFPVMKTPVNKSILVYIPRTNVITDGEGKEVLQVLNSLQHNINRGRFTEKHRCIKGLSGNPAADHLGYDGECPFCEATTHVWELYNIQMEAKAKAKGLPSVESDTADVLKEDRKKVLEEREIHNAEEYVTFNIVIIPSENNTPTPTAVEDMQPVFVQWSKKRYDDKLLKALTGMYNKPDHLGGLFMIWDFTYDTGGKPANARDSAQKATYTIVQDAGALEAFKVFIERAEEISKDFTLVKASEVMVANKFLYKEDIDRMAIKYTRKTMDLLELSKSSQGLVGVQPVAQLAQGTNPLQSFGMGGTQQMGMQQQPMQQQMQQQPPQENPLFQQQQQPMQQQQEPMQQQQQQQQGNPLFQQ